MNSFSMNEVQYFNISINPQHIDILFKSFQLMMEQDSFLQLCLCCRDSISLLREFATLLNRSYNDKPIDWERKIAL